MRDYIKYIIKRLAAFPQFLVVRSKDKGDFLKRNWLENNYRTYRFLCRLYRSYPLSVFMNVAVIRLRAFLVDDDFKVEIRNLWLEVFVHSDENLQYFITKMFFLTEIVDQYIAKTIMAFAKNTSNADYRYWTTMDISNVLFNSQIGLYKGFYNERKKLLEQIALEGKYKVERDKSNKTATGVLGIVVYQLEPSIQNSVFRCLKMVVDGLEKYYDKICVISTDSFYTSSNDICATTIYYKYSKLTSSDVSDKCKFFFGDKVKVLAINNGNFRQRNQELLTKLYAISPETIIDLTDEFSPASFFYSKDFTTFYIPLRAGISSSFFSYQLGPKWRLEAMCEKYGERIDMDKAIEWSFPEYLPQMIECYDRSSVGLEDKSFVIVTAAYVSKICSNDFSDAICSLLRKNTDFVWLIVGDTVPEYIHCNYEDLIVSRQIIERAYENNLFALFKLCNLYLRTEVTGGSGATAIAAMAGLPIVMTNYLCDPMRWLGKDYSVISSLDQLVNEINRLYKDSEYYEEKKQICQRLVDDAVDAEKKWKQLLDIMKRNSIE